MSVHGHLVNRPDPIGMKVADHSNEIPIFPQLLKVLALSGCIVTTDAMECQTQIVQQIIDVDASHIALNVADPPATYDRLQVLDGPCNTQPFPSSYPEGWGWFYARDPDGITVEFNGPLN